MKLFIMMLSGRKTRQKKKKFQSIEKIYSRIEFILKVVSSSFFFFFNSFCRYTSKVKIFLIIIFNLGSRQPYTYIGFGCTKYIFANSLLLRFLLKVFYKSLFSTYKQITPTQDFSIIHGKSYYINFVLRV